MYPRPGGEIKDTLQFYLEESSEGEQPFELAVGNRRSNLNGATTRGNENRESMGSNYTSGHKLVRSATKAPAHGGRRKERPV